MKFAALALACGIAFGQSVDWQTQVRNRNYFPLTIANDATIGTTLNELAKVSSTGAIAIGTSDTAIPVFCVMSGAGMTGDAILASGGTASCKTDAGGATAGHFLVASTTTGATLHDAGATAPTSGWIVGQALANASANANVSFSISPGYDGASSGITQLTGDATAGPGTGSQVASVVKVNGNTPGGTCTNQFPRSIDSSGRPTCASIATLDLPASGASAGTYTNPTTTVDATGRITSISNGTASATSLVMTDYSWTPQAPGISLSAGTPTSVTLMPCPLGVPTTGQSVYIQGGTGTAETVTRTGGTCTSGLGTGTFAFTPANNHTGSWTLGPASSGLQEAANAAGNSGSVFVPGNTSGWPIYAAALIPSGTQVYGAGMRISLLLAEGATVGVIDLPGGAIGYLGNNIADIGIESTVQQTSGGFGIRVGSTGEHSFARITRVFLYLLYDGVLGVNASNGNFTDSVCYDFSDTCITSADAANPDNNGFKISGLNCFEQNNTAAANACIYATSTGGITVVNSTLYGSSIGSGNGQLNYDIRVNATQSTQVAIANSVLETANIHNIDITGVYNLIALTGDTIAQPSAAQNLWRGIEVNGNNTTSFCGSGIGICQGTITGVVIQGPGTTSTSSVCIELTGYVTNFDVGDNTCNQSQIGINVGANVTTSTIGHLAVANLYSQPLSGGSSTTIWNRTANTGFATLPTAANGSELFVTDANSGCTAGSSTGRTCFRENSAWTH